MFETHFFAYFNANCTIYSGEEDVKYTIIAPLCDAELLDLIQTSLKLTGSIDFICDEKRVSYLVDDKGHAHFMQTIARLTVCYYKKKYYTSLFSTMRQCNKLGCLLLSALVWYDLEQESSQAYKCLPDSHYLNLLGFYQFRLPFLENRWNELSQMLKQLDKSKKLYLSNKMGKM